MKKNLLKSNENITTEFDIYKNKKKTKYNNLKLSYKSIELENINYKTKCNELENN